MDQVSWWDVPLRELLAEFDRGEITERCLSHLLALHFWDNQERSKK